MELFASVPQLAKRLALAAIMAFACGTASAKEWNRIRIGTEGAYPPFNYFDANGQLQGFEIDLARAICATLKVECEFVAQDWEGLIPALLVGKYDVIFASMSITQDRLKTIAFSERYYSSPAMFVTSRAVGSTSVDPEAMAGKKIGAQSATASARYLQERYAPAGASVKFYVTQDEATLDLASGRLDAVLGDKLVLMSWLESAPDGGCCRVAGPDLDDPAYFGSGIGAGLRKQDVALKALIDKGIAAVRADGDYERINAKYFPFSLY